MSCPCVSNSSLNVNASGDLMRNSRQTKKLKTKLSQSKIELCRGKIGEGAAKKVNNSLPIE